MSLARVALRFGISVGAVNELVRRAFVEAAEQNLAAADGGKPVQTARICALTGLYRKEVVRLKSLPPPGDPGVDDRYNRSARIIAGWLRDPDFRTRAGAPAVLRIDGEGGFNELVRRYSGDMTPRAMLEELERLGAVARSRGGTLKLTAHAYIPRSNELDTVQILGTDTADLIDTILHNLDHGEDERRFQRKVSYLHIPARQVDPFRRYASQQSQALLERLDRWLAARDTERVDAGGAGSRLGLGIYLIERATPRDGSESPASPSDRATPTGDADR